MHFSALVCPPRLVQKTLNALRAVNWQIPVKVVPLQSTPLVCSASPIGCALDSRVVQVCEPAAKELAAWSQSPKLRPPTCPPSVWDLLNDGAVFVPRAGFTLASTGMRGLGPNALPDPVAYLDRKSTGAAVDEMHSKNSSVGEGGCPSDFSFKFVDLLCGVGGFRIGLEALGGECVFSCEIDAVASQCYSNNFPGITHEHSDIFEIDDATILPHDILCSGFPCQPYSTLGQQKGFADERSLLFWEVLRVARRHQPSAIILENVPGLLRVEGGACLRTIVRELSACGYTVGWRILDAAGLVPQERRRLFIVAIRNDLRTAIESFRFPEVPDLKSCVNDILQSENELDPAHNLHLSKEEWQGLSGGINEDTRIGNGTAATLIRSYKKTSPFSQLVTPTEANDSGPRLFSPREVARLQGFPETFLLPDAPNDCYHVLGNAVPPPLVALVAGSVLCALQHSGRTCRDAGREVAISLAMRSRPKFLVNTAGTKGGVATGAREEEETMAKEEETGVSAPKEKDVAVAWDPILERFQAELRLPSRAIGAVLGRRGSRAQELMGTHKCRIYIEPKPDDASDSLNILRPVYVWGASETGVRSMLQELLGHLRTWRGGPKEARGTLRLHLSLTTINSPRVTDAVTDVVPDIVTDAATGAVTDVDADATVDELGGDKDTIGLNFVSVGGAVYGPDCIPWHRSRPAIVTSALLMVCREGD